MAVVSICWPRSHQIRSYTFPFYQPVTRLTLPHQIIKAISLHLITHQPVNPYIHPQAIFRPHQPIPEHHRNPINQLQIIPSGISKLQNISASHHPATKHHHAETASNKTSLRPPFPANFRTYLNPHADAIYFPTPINQYKNIAPPLQPVIKHLTSLSP